MYLGQVKIYGPSIGFQYDKSKGFTYTVVLGDTLSKLAQRFWQNASLWPTIQKANNLTSTVISIGQKLLIPPKPPVWGQPQLKIINHQAAPTTTEVIELPTTVIRGTPPRMTQQQKTGLTIGAILAGLLLFGG